VKRSIGEGSYPLGIKDSGNWKEISGTIDCGDSLLFYSDGIVESRDATGHDFGYEYLQTIVEWHPVHSSAELMERVLNEWKSFTRGQPLQDDISIAVIRRRISPSL
jgi:sigma-B regulation protein RsbU (phosphoserine phosphatase)